MKKFLTFVSILFLFGCGQRSTPNVNKDIPKSIIYTTYAGDKIIFLDDYYRVYLKAIKADYKNRKKIYESQVRDSIFNKYFSNGEYAALVNNMLSTPIRDTNSMGSYISGIADNRTRIEGLIDSALAKSNKYLKNDSLIVYILPCTIDIEKIIEGMGGVTGLTAGRKQIIITINPKISRWNEMLPYNIAREYYHTWWTKMNFNASYKPTLLNALVFEGRADSYAHLICPNTPAPWTKALSEQVDAELWNRIKSQLKNQGIAYKYSVMFGSKNEYPPWGGYTLGYDIVQSALKNHPELTPADWANLPSEKVLEMSDFK